MQITPVTSASTAASDSTAATTTTKKQTLGQADFLKLLSVQFQSQDPMKPMEDTQFISQMASFTSLEQMQTLSKDFAAFSTQQQLMSAQNFLGKTVTVATEAGNITGPVTKVDPPTGVACDPGAASVDFTVRYTVVNADRIEYLQPGGQPVAEPVPVFDEPAAPDVPSADPFVVDDVALFALADCVL